MVFSTDVEKSGTQLLQIHQQRGISISDIPTPGISVSDRSARSDFYVKLSGGGGFLVFGTSASYLRSKIL